MGHNSVVSGHPKSTGIPRVDGLSTGPPDLGRYIRDFENFRFSTEITALPFFKKIEFCSSFIYICIYI